MHDSQLRNPVHADESSDVLHWYSTVAPGPKFLKSSWKKYSLTYTGMLSENARQTLIMLQSGEMPE